MTKRKIVQAFGVLVVLLTVLIFFILPSKPSAALETTATGKLDFNKDGRLEKMADTIHKYLDTSFYAEYRVKPGRYYFNYRMAQHDGNPFTISEFIESHVFELPKHLGVRTIQRNPGNNYISFQILDNNNKSKNIIVLDVGQDTIKSSTLGNIPVTSFSGGEEIKIGRYKSIAQQSSRIYIVSNREVSTP